MVNLVPRSNCVTGNDTRARVGYFITLYPTAGSWNNCCMYIDERLQWEAQIQQNNKFAKNVGII